MREHLVESEHQRDLFVLESSLVCGIEEGVVESAVAGRAAEGFIGVGSLLQDVAGSSEGPTELCGGDSIALAGSAHGIDSELAQRFIDEPLRALVELLVRVVASVPVALCVLHGDVGEDRW